MKQQARNHSVMHAKILEEVNNVFTEIFTPSGREAVLYYLQVNHGVTLKDAVERPAALEEAFAVFFGEFGASILTGRIIRRINAISRALYGLPRETLSLDLAVKTVLGELNLVLPNRNAGA